MLHLFKVDNLPSDKLLLTGDAGKHASAALRLRIGEKVQFTDGAGNIAIGTVSEVISKNEIKFSLSDHAVVSEPRPRISVLQALPKGDKAVEAVELMVEVGVDHIYPWQAVRSIAKWDEKKKVLAIAKWQTTADAAAAQARRAWFPKVHNLVTDLQTLSGKFDQIIVFHEENSPAIPDQIAENVLIVIGPEGSITDAELLALADLGAVQARMGESILRSRHAGIAAAAAVLSRTARWGK